VTGSKPSEITQKIFLAWAVCCPVADNVVVLARILAPKFSNTCSLMCMNEQFLNGYKNNSMENTTWSAMEKQTTQTEKVYYRYM